MSAVKSKLMTYAKKLLYRHGTTPLPATAVTIFVLLMTFNAMTTTALFSFLPQMVKSFGASEVDAGRYAGIVASSVHVGRLFSSILWGYIVDSKGKKVSVIICGSGLVLATLMFGFSFNIYSAVIFRFLQGSFVGLVVITNAHFSDLCDETNISLGMSLVIISNSVGFILGPCVGGFTAFPADQYPKIFPRDGLFGKFGILLPSFIVSVLLAVSVMLAGMYLRNHEDHTIGNEQELLVISDKGRSYGMVDKNVISKAGGGIEDVTTNTSSLTNSNISKGNIDGDTCSNINTTYTLQRCIDTNEEKYVINDTPQQQNGNNENHINPTGISHGFNGSVVEKFKRSRLYEVLLIKQCLYSCLMYCWFSLQDIGFTEIFPLFLATDPRYNGMGFSTSQIGTLLTIVAIFLPIVQILFVPKIADYFGAKNTLIYSNLLLFFVFPILGELVAIQNKIALWICVITYRILVNCLLVAGVVCINILLNNAVKPELLGSANGVGMALASLGRVVSPIACGSLFTWSLGNTKGVKGNKKRTWISV